MSGRRGTHQNWALLLALVCACSVRAQPAAEVDVGPLPSAVGWSAERDAGHGWFVAPIFDQAIDRIRSERGEAGPRRPARWVLAHVPPRRAGMREGAPPGTIRLALAMDAPPRLMAAHAHRVYMLHDGEGVLEDPRLSMVGAWPGPGAGLWAFSPSGRASPMPPPGPGRALDLAATRDGPLILMEDSDALSMRLLFRQRWREVTLPAAFVEGVMAEDGPARARVLTDADRVHLVLLDGAGAARVWRARVEPTRDGGEVGSATPPPTTRDTSASPSLLDGSAPSLLGGSSVIAASSPIEPEWSQSVVRAPDDPSSVGSGRLWWSGLGLGWAERVGEDAITVHGGGGGAALELTRVEGMAAWAGVIPIPSDRRLVVVWPASVESGAYEAMSAQARAWADSPRGYEIAEVSLDTGEPLYRGKVEAGAPISADEFRAIAVLLFGMMGLLVVFALRRDPSDGVVTLPPGTALAEPGRRAIASLLDGAVAIAAIAGVLGVPMRSLFDTQSWLDGAVPLWALPAVLGVGIAHGTLGEALFGRTLGKFALGCRVVGSRPGDGGRPPLARTLVRNVFKWALPPGTLLAFVTPGFRHRGDVVSECVVVREARAEREGEGSENG